MATAKSASNTATGAVLKKSHASAPRSLAIAEAGVTTSQNFAALMSATIADVISGRLSTEVANAAVAAGRTLLKVVEMEHKYGKAQPPATTRERPVLELAPKPDGAVEV